MNVAGPEYATHIKADGTAISQKEKHTTVEEEREQTMQSSPL